MTETVTRRRIEILADAPLLRRIVASAADAGVTHYTILPVLGGRGHTGDWTDDQVTGATAKRLFMAVCGHSAADDFVDRIAPLLDSHGLLLMLGDVEVIRAERF